jgi:hypothetical protein
MVFSLSTICPLQDRKAFHRALNTDYVRVTVLRRLKHTWHELMQGPTPSRAGLA